MLYHIILPFSLFRLLLVVPVCPHVQVFVSVCVHVFTLHPIYSRFNSDVAPSDSHSKPAIPELGVLSAVFEQDETHSWAVVAKCVSHLRLNRGGECNQVSAALK